jgi:hypothetical protein
MSTFMISDDTMRRVLMAVHITCPNTTIANTFIPPTDSQIGRREAALTELGHKLFAMNAAAVDACYGRGEHKEFREPWDDFRFEFETLRNNFTRKQACEYYKALCCLLYQCAEGAVDQSATYKQLEAIRDRLANDIVQDLPEYDAAPWD